MNRIWFMQFQKFYFIPVQISFYLAVSSGQRQIYDRTFLDNVYHIPKENNMSKENPDRQNCRQYFFQTKKTLCHNYYTQKKLFLREFFLDSISGQWISYVICNRKTYMQCNSSGQRNHLLENFSGQRYPLCKNISGQLNMYARTFPDKVIYSGTILDKETYFSILLVNRLSFDWSFPSCKIYFRQAFQDSGI